jgi:hypothetical protein
LTAIARLLLLLVIFQSSAFAFEEIHLQLDSIETTFFNTKNIVLSLEPQQSPQPGLSLQISTIHSPYIKQSFDASFDCVDLIYTVERINCGQGVLKLVYAEQEHIEIDFTFWMNILDKSGQLTLATTLENGNVIVDFQLDVDSNWQADIDANGLELAFISTVLELSKEYSIIDGKASLKAHMGGSEDRFENISLDANFTQLDIEGESVLDSVGIHTQMDMKIIDDNWSFITTLSLLAGEMYIQPGLNIMGEEPGFYIEVPAESIDFRLAGNWRPDKNTIELQDLYYSHPAVMQLQGSVRLALAEEISYSDLTLHAVIEDLGSSYPTYVQPILMQTNFSDLELSGAIDLSLDYEGTELNQIELFVDDLFLEDVESRFGLYGLNSHLALHSESEAVQSTLRWDGMSFYRLDFGPGNIIFESMGKDVSVLEWRDVSILDGGLKIEEFALRNLASSEFELELGGTLTPISMEALTQALGWTIFPGKLSGEISGLKYTKNNLSLEGDIAFNLFGGQLNIQELQVDNLFSSYSVLTTDIKIDQLDLEQLTDVFTFGKIEGSLNGRMDKLRLENWQPSYFEMEFSTPEKDDKPHRISQKALENLNELGGGLSGTLSQGFLRFLPAYSYGRLGLGCRLSRGVCELSGVEDDGDSFSILTKGGMFPPWVEVKGAGRSIKWDDLIDGLNQIIEGEVAIE